MKPGDLIGFHSSGLFARLIRFGQRYFMRLNHWQISHIAVVVDVADGDAEVVQAVRRVDQVKLSSYGTTPYVVIPFPGPEERRADVVAAARSKLGQDYGLLSVFSDAIDMLVPGLHVEVIRNGRMCCSALGSWCWEHGGVIVPWLSTAQVTPGQIPDAYGEETAS